MINIIKSPIKHLLGILFLIYVLPMQAQPILPDIVDGEYFFDADPGYGFATPISFSQGNTLNLNEILTYNPLSNGHHFLGLRFKDTDNNWGMTYTHCFTVNNNTHLNEVPFVTAVEYFFDTDSGYAKQSNISITSDSVLSLNQLFDLATLQQGNHFVGIRAKDSTNNWGITHTFSFYTDKYSNVSPSDLLAYEYFFNTEPGIGNATSLMLTADTLWDFTQLFDLDTLPLGSNFLGIRALNEHSQFGITYIRPFTKLVPPVLYNLSGGGAYCQGTSGLNAILDDSETGVSYILFKDSVEFDTLPGTDTNLVWTNLTAGTYTVTAYFTNAPHIYEVMNDTVLITENPLPLVNCPSDYNACINVDSIVLQGATPTGGTYSGTSVNNGYFFPSQLAGGDYEITYIYEDVNSCVDSCQFIISVDSLPEVICPADMEVCNETDSIELTSGLPTGGTYSGSAVSNGYFHPAQLSTGDYDISYTYLDSNACINSCIFKISILSTPVVSCDSNYAMCIDADSLLLSGGLPIGGTYSGTGVSNGYFNPAVALPGNHVITYSISDTNSCNNTCSFTITVFDYPSVSFTGLDSFYCVYNDAVSLTGNPTTGTFSGQGMNGNIFDPEDAGIGFWDISYNYTDTNGCSNSFILTVEVGECLGLNTAELNTFKVYPNPASYFIIIEINEAELKGKEVSYQLCDIQGRVLKSAPLVSSKNNIDVSAISRGLYFLNVFQGDSLLYVFKHVKE